MKEGDFVSFTVERANQMLKLVQNTIKQKTLPIERVEFQEGREDRGEWKSMPQYWGEHDHWYLMRTEFVIPEDYAGETVKISLSTGREGEWNAKNPQFLLRINGEVKQALDTNHTDFILAKNAAPGTKYQIALEAYAGRDDENNGAGFLDHPLQLHLCAYCWCEEAEALYFDLSVAMEAAKMRKPSEYERIQIEEYLTKAMNLLDLRIPGSSEYFSSVHAARKFMQNEFYGKLCGQSEVIANCVGHTHIDVAWLWRVEQTRAKAVRSFATEIALLEEYPEHYFSSSQPQLYQYVKEDCPEIYEKIKQYVKEGRWEPEGAMWLEADCNLTSGESLIRQILHGKRFMMEEFGVNSKILWLPDVFGYAAALPQILKKSGVDTFVTSKIHWNESNHFPYDTFLWKGIDGTEIFSQFITGGDAWGTLGDGNQYSTYNSFLTPGSLAKGWEIYQQKNINNEILVSFGYGDGGGGVTREMIERNRRIQKGIPGVPKSRITTMNDTINRIKKNTEGKKLPRWVGELYLEFHRGTYTSQAQVKRNNRKCEFLLQETETASLINQLLLDGDYDKAGIYQDWQTVLLNQFHDILPGSSIHEVYEDCARDYQVVRENNQKRLDSALSSLAANLSEPGIVVYNPIGITQGGVVRVDGKEYFAKDVPAYGWKMVSEESSKKSLSVSKTKLENDFFLIEFDKDMNISRLFDKRSDREVLPEGARANVIQAYDDHPREYDNWELCNYYPEIMWEVNDVASVELEEHEESAALKIKRRFLNSTIEQKIMIYRELERIDFDTEADWNEHHIFLKAAFPVDVFSDKATYEIQYGATERPTHYNNSWDAAKFEVCAQKWSDYAEPNYGAAILNDCKYGQDVHDGVMRLSLLKCGTYPDPMADVGHHTFRYSFMPHAGDWRSAGVSNEAYAFNCPLIAYQTAGMGDLPKEFSLISADQPNIFITTVKKACDGEDLIVRAYEAYGERTKTTIRTGVEFSAAEESDMMETKCEKLLSVKDGHSIQLIFHPYEIKTIRIKR